MFKRLMIEITPFIRLVFLFEDADGFARKKVAEIIASNAL